MLNTKISTHSPTRNYEDIDRPETLTFDISEKLSIHNHYISIVYQIIIMINHIAMVGLCLNLVLGDVFKFCRKNRWIMKYMNYSCMEYIYNL